MGRITDLATGFPGYDARIPASAGLLPEMLVAGGLRGLRRGQVAPDPRRGPAPRGPALQLAAGPGLRALLRLHGRARPTSSRRRSSHDNHRVAPPRSADDGYHLTEDLVDRAIEFVADLRHVQPDQPFLLHLALGRVPLAPPGSPGRGSSTTGVASITDGTAGGPRRSSASTTGGGARRRSGSRPGRTGFRPGNPSARTSSASTARYMECFAGHARPTPTSRSAGCSTSSTSPRRARGHAHRAAVGQRCLERRAAPTGSINDVRPWNLADRPVAEALERIDEIGGPCVHNNYPWGWTVAGNTPFRRWKREVARGGRVRPAHRPLARPASWPGARCARQYVHAIDLLPTVLDAVGVDRPVDHRRGRAEADRRRELRSTYGVGPTPRRSAPPSTSRCSGVGRSTTTAGRP